MKEKIGFIGLGTMGKPMGFNLMKAGYELMVYDIKPQAGKGISGERRGGRAIDQRGGGPIGRGYNHVPNSGDVETVILKEGGAMEGLKSHSIVIDMSTIDPSVSRKIAKVLREKEIHMLDAPVSGGQMGAEAGTLAIMVGGEEEIFKRCLAIFKAMGKNIFYCGPSGNGEIVKIVNNLMSGVIRLLSAEALALGVKAGVPLKVLYDVVNESSGQSKSVQVSAASKPFKGDYEPGFAS